MSDDDAEVAALSAHYLKIAYRANGQIPVKVEILSPDHSLDSVRATYKAWFIDLWGDDSFDDPRPTIHWEEGVAHFFREGGKWEHNYNAVMHSGIRDLDGPFLDEGVAEQWKRLKALWDTGLAPNNLDQ
jgi:hypothetical protein